MGEFAGYALDEVADHEDDRLDWKLGRMCHGRAYDLGIIDEFGYEKSPRAVTGYACKYCKRRGMLWKQTEKGYRLFEGETMHSCAAYFK